MRLIDLSLDQLSTNSLLCRLRYDSSPRPSSSSVFFRLLSFFFFYPPSSSIPPSLSPESLSSVYRETEKEQYKKNVQSKKNEKEPIQHKKKKETQLREKNEQWNAREKREREHGFYVIAIEIDFYGRFILHLSYMQSN